MKILKIILYVVVLLLVMIIGVVAWLFSDSGNTFLKNKITEIANKEAPIGLEFTHFKLDFGSYAFVITDNADSKIALSGEFDIFLNTKAKLNAIVTDLSPYESLLGMKLNGGLSFNGDIVKDSSNIDVKAELLAFNSVINADVSMVDYKPSRLFVNSKDGINIASLLYFLNQKQYATGQILLNADMDISNLQAPSGGFNIASQAIRPNVALLESDFGVSLPKDAIKLAIQGEAKNSANGGIIVSNILASSSYLNIDSKGLTLSLNDNSTNGVINTSLQKIKASGFSLKDKLGLALTLKSDKINNQQALISINAITNPILVHIEMPNYAPKNIVLSGENISLKEILHFVSLPYEAKGNINFGSTISNIDTTNMSYKIQANVKSNIESLVFDELNLADNNYFNADINGDSKKIQANISSNLFDSKMEAKANLENYAPTFANINLKNLNLQKLAKLLNYNANGFLDANVNIDDFTKLNGKFDISSKQINITKSTLNSLSGMDFKKDISFKLDGSGKFNNGSGNGEIDINGDSIALSLNDIVADINSNTYGVNFKFHTPKVEDINPLKMNLNGKLSLSGKAGLRDNIPYASLQNNDFGTLNVDFENEKLKLVGENLDVKKLADFSGNGKIIKGGKLDMLANLDIKSKDMLKNLNGNVLLRGEKLELYSIDIDALANSFDSATNINLYDIGAMVVAGPLGFAATKGASIGKNLGGMIEGKTAIRELNAGFNLKNGVIHTSDVAFSTGKTRIAALGAINLNTESFQNFSIGLLDDKNCAKYEQKISGTLSNPKFEVTKSTIENALSVAASLFDKIKKGSSDILRKPKEQSNENCTPFYRGVVK